MITTIIPNFSVLPQRSDPSNFSVFRDIWLTEEQLRITLTNDVADEMNIVSAEVNNNAQTAIDKAASAAASALQAESFANSKGAWSELTGTLNVPASVTHTGSVWVLNVNLANVTLSEPIGGNSDWTEVSGVTQQELDLKADQTTTYTKTENDASLSLKSGLLFDKPNTEVLFTKTAVAGFTIPIGFKVSVGDTTFETATLITLSLNSNLDTGSKVAGTDYYVYARSSATFYISADKNIVIDRLIGGFHYGLTPESEAPTGNKTEADMVAIRGINQYSFWDLKFRPVANPEGMVHIGGKWYDIYLLNSGHITNGTSKAGATIAGGSTSGGRGVPKIPLEYGGNGTVTYGKFTWFQACEIAKSHSKELIPYSEFPTIAYGVTEQKSSQVDGYEVVTGKIEHYSNLTSKYGIEQASGTQWLWGADVNADANTGSFQAVTDGRGSIYANASELNAVLLGASRDYGVNAGSRASNWSYYVWDSSGYFGSRFACDHLELV